MNVLRLKLLNCNSFLFHMYLLHGLNVVNRAMFLTSLLIERMLKRFVAVQWLNYVGVHTIIIFV